MDLTQARAKIKKLDEKLQTFADRDAEQELQGPALHDIDAVLEAARVLVPNHEVIREMEPLISVDSVDRGEPIRVLDILPRVGILRAALGEEPEEWRKRLDEFGKRHRR